MTARGDKQIYGAGDCRLPVLEIAMQQDGSKSQSSDWLMMDASGFCWDWWPSKHIISHSWAILSVAIIIWLWLVAEVQGFSAVSNWAHVFNAVLDIHIPHTETQRKLVIALWSTVDCERNYNATSIILHWVINCRWQVHNQCSKSSSHWFLLAVRR